MVNNKKIHYFLILIFLILCNSCRDKVFEDVGLFKTANVISSPPNGFSSFYKKYLDAAGIPVLSSEKVDDLALIRVRKTIMIMLAKRPDVLAQLKIHRAKVCIIAQEEVTTDLPEYGSVEDKESFNQRGRGYGATISEPITSCAEENVLRKGEDDGWNGEDILIHELAHAIMNLGLIFTNQNFERTLQDYLNDAKSKGLWINTYAETNVQEYFAELTQKWFNSDLLGSVGGDGLHNEINTREKLKRYDPKMYALLKTIFYDTNWRPELFPNLTN